MWPEYSAYVPAQEPCGRRVQLDGVDLLGAEVDRGLDLVAAGGADDEQTLGRRAERGEGDRIGRRGRSRASEAGSPSHGQIAEPQQPVVVEDDVVREPHGVDAEQGAPLATRRSWSVRTLLALLGADRRGQAGPHDHDEPSRPWRRPRRSDRGGGRPRLRRRATTSRTAATAATIETGPTEAMSGTTIRHASAAPARSEKYRRLMSFGPAGEQRATATPMGRKLTYRPRQISRSSAEAHHSPPPARRPTARACRAASRRRRRSRRRRATAAARVHQRRSDVGPRSVAGGPTPP